MVVGMVSFVSTMLGRVVMRVVGVFGKIGPCNVTEIKV